MVSRCFPGGYNVKLYISRGRLAWWLLAFLHSATVGNADVNVDYGVFQNLPVWNVDIPALNSTPEFATLKD